MDGFAKLNLSHLWVLPLLHGHAARAPGVMVVDHTAQ